MTRKAIIVGTGGWGAWWCEQFLPPNIQDGTIDVVAAVDVDPAAHENAQKFLGLSAGQCYTDARSAFTAQPADFCIIAVPPSVHESVVDAALDAGLNILSEKPIADSLEASIRIADKVRSAGRKMAVTMSHRFDQDKTSLRTEIRSGLHGRLDYLSGRYSCDLRRKGSWGFRHDMDHPLLFEGAIHHLDLLVDMAGAKCASVYATTWNPPWSDFKNNAQGLMILQCENGVRIQYEGADTNAIGLNPWSSEYIRAECEQATLILDHRELECFPYDPEQTWVHAREGTGTKIPLLEQNKWANTWLVEQFVSWLDGGPRMETDVERNLQSVAIVTAAIESNQTGQPVSVQSLLDNARKA